MSASKVQTTTAAESTMSCRHRRTICAIATHVSIYALSTGGGAAAAAESATTAAFAPYVPITHSSATGTYSPRVRPRATELARERSAFAALAPLPLSLPSHLPLAALRGEENDNSFLGRTCNSISSGRDDDGDGDGDDDCHGSSRDSLSGDTGVEKKNDRDKSEEKGRVQPKFPIPWISDLSFELVMWLKPPPFYVDDLNLLFYDVALLLNLSLSISFWVVHRMSFYHIGTALSEGSLLCILWILAGLYNGAFLHSAVDGHQRKEGGKRGGQFGDLGGSGSSSGRSSGAGDDGEHDDGGIIGNGGPPAAGLLALSTFVGTCNLRIVVALAQAMAEHRPVGLTDGEKLIPLEIFVGLMLMSSWRAMHSYFTPRV